MTDTTTTTRLFMLVEGVSFALASAIHRGVFIDGYEHSDAATAESVIAAVVLVGLVLTWAWQGRTRLIGLVAQGFALLGTLVGLFTIAVGVGPRTTPDVIYHLVIIVVLAAGLLEAWRSPENASGRA